MHFALTEDQVALRDTVRELLAAQCPPDVVRAAWPAGEPTALDGLWDALATMGVFGAAVPEEAGGLGLDETDLVPLLEEFGYAAVPLPVAETATVVAPLLAAAGDRRLPAVLSGVTRVALAGADRLVPYGLRADLVLVLTDTQARLVAPQPDSVLPTVDGSRALTRLSDATGELVTDDPELVSSARHRAELATSAQLVGLGRRMLDLTVEYVGQRRQFGVPIGSFQAVKHHLADALLRIEFAAPAVHAAGWALARRHPGRATDVSMAVVLASEAAQDVARAAIQCHGAIGYTVEYDLHLYAKRTWALAAGCDVDAHLDRLAGALDLKEEPA
ncbi:acyl-CoA dehydrogenase family protein [Micromonospora sp. NPDC020750]|uniref:acyl-CoA dehydrogenase family protein n=1 Tax=unclassified Micromonospora TaxID=2617518 RepID=UPI0037A62353